MLDGDFQCGINIVWLFLHKVQLNRGGLYPLNELIP